MSRPAPSIPHFLIRLHSTKNIAKLSPEYINETITSEGLMDSYETVLCAEIDKMYRVGGTGEGGEGTLREEGARNALEVLGVLRYCRLKPEGLARF